MKKYLEISLTNLYEDEKASIWSTPWCSKLNQTLPTTKIGLLHPKVIWIMSRYLTFITIWIVDVAKTRGKNTEKPLESNYDTP